MLLLGTMMTDRIHRLSRNAGTAVLLATVIGIVLYICTFKIIDSDFWWHVKAGELIWTMRSLIHTEPFSFVLAGMPYTSSHEWLAQVIFYHVFHLGGVTAAILFRGALIAAAALFLLLIDRRSALVTAPLVVLFVYMFRASLMVRPQLFTILLTALVLFLVFRYVRAGEEGERTRRKRQLFFLSILGTEIFWVNVHGAAAIFGVVIMTGLALQGVTDWYTSAATDRSFALQELRFRALCAGAVLLAMLISPNFFRTFLDMYQHRFDATIPLVREWMPLSAAGYVKQVLPFAVIAGALLALVRRAPVLCLFVLALTGALSLEAYRHCVIFVLACTAITIFQLAGYHPWTRFQEKILRFPLPVYGVSVLVPLLLLWFGMYRHDITTLKRGNDAGFGVNIPVAGAVDFAEREHIRGTLFNTYNQGGYILYRCSPQCLVFADGRNIQYGYPFLQKLQDASTNPVRWRELDDRYHFTYAIVEYKSTPKYGDLLPYINNIEADPSWTLLYLDDSGAVYVRDRAEYAELIRRFAYTILTPAALEFSDTLETLPESRWTIAEAELIRSAKESPLSIKPRLLLGNRYLATNRLAEAESIAREALAAQPYLPEIYELLGRISVERQDWSEAGAYLEKAAALTNGEGQTINYDYLAMIFSRAGENDKAEKYHRKAVRAGQNSPVRKDQ